MRLLEKYLIILLTTFLVGCGGSGEGVSVSGKVTFNDEPVTNGEIFFLSQCPRGELQSSHLGDSQNGGDEAGPRRSR